MWSRVGIHGVTPESRTCHTASVWRNKVFIFGGWNGTKMLDDVHELDTETSSWQKKSIGGQGPSARAGHTAVVLENKLIVFGGADGRQFLNDIFSLDLEEMYWMHIIPCGPSPCPRTRHAAAATASGHMCVFGGTDRKELFNSVHLFILKTNTWCAVNTASPPSARWGHTLIAIGNELYLFGGHDGAMRSDLYSIELTGNAAHWNAIEPKGDIPLPRAGQTVVVLGNNLVVFGGGSEGSMLNDLAYFDLETSTWSKPHISGPPPAARAGHTSVTINSRMFVFGGGDGDKRRFKDLYVLEDKKKWISIPRDTVQSEAYTFAPPHNSISAQLSRTLPSDEFIPPYAHDLFVSEQVLEACGMGEYKQLFVAEQLGPSTFPFVTDAHLQGFGITKPAHRIRILAALHLYTKQQEALLEQSKRDENQHSIHNLMVSVERLSGSLTVLVGDLKSTRDLVKLQLEEEVSRLRHQVGLLTQELRRDRESSELRSPREMSNLDHSTSQPPTPSPHNQIILTNSTPTSTAPSPTPATAPSTAPPATKPSKWLGPGLPQSILQPPVPAPTPAPIPAPPQQQTADEAKKAQTAKPRSKIGTQ